MSTEIKRCPNANDEPCKWPYCTCADPWPVIDEKYIDAQLNKANDPADQIQMIESDARSLKTAAFAVALALAIASILYITAI